MRAIPFFIALTFFPATLCAAEDPGAEADSSAIRAVVAGKICTGDGVLIFGASSPGASGRYERVGLPQGQYRIGDGTILIRRGKDLHSHVATVSVQEHMLFMSTGKYHCDP